QVNKNFAIDLIAEQPVSEVESRVIWCDGGGGALGHPKVYINLDKDTKTGTCGYCGLQFKQKHH
ncbi:NDUS6 protein, partial [Calonectris borealis]|nr:NDUS6 protein [Calonectris borealis]